MNLAALAVAMSLAAAPTAEAAEPPPVPTPLKLRPKAALAAAAPSLQASAPFVVPSGEPDLDLLPRPDPRLEQSRSSCSGERALCYDPQSRRIVYKPARALMPDIPGLHRENISVRRDRITFRYSFQ
jgi:hypothetical protein